MRCYILSKGSARGQEFKWYSCDKNGNLDEEKPTVWSDLTGLLDTREPSLALVNKELSLALVVTNIKSNDRNDFASRNIYTHLILLSESDKERSNIQNLAASALKFPDIFIEDIDKAVRPSGENNFDGVLVDRKKLTDPLGQYWGALRKKTYEWDDFKSGINKIIDEHKYDIKKPFRDDSLFKRRLKEIHKDLWVDNDENNSHQKTPKISIKKEIFIREINDLINCLEIGFFVNSENLCELINKQDFPSYNDGVIKDRKVAKNTKDMTNKLSDELKKYLLPKHNGILLVVTGDISSNKYEKLPHIYRVLNNIESHEDWQDLDLASSEPNSTDSSEEKNSDDSNSTENENTEVGESGVRNSNNFVDEFKHRLEKSNSQPDIIEVINYLLETLAGQSFSDWIKNRLLAQPLDLTEIKTMLRQRVSKWTHEWEQQGWVKGVEQGLKKEKGLLTRLIQRRFGQAVVEQVQAKIMLIHDSDNLEKIGDWIVDCKDGEEFLSEFTRHYTA